MNAAPLKAESKGGSCCGALPWALYRRIKAADSPYWLESAVRRTALPFVPTGVFVSATSAAMAAYAPDVQSIAQAMQHRFR